MVTRLCLAKSSPIRRKLPTIACCSQEKREKRCKVNQLCFKVLVLSNFGTTCKSKYFSAIEVFNLIVMSKSLPVEVNNSADNLIMSLICPLR